MQLESYLSLRARKFNLEFHHFWLNFRTCLNLDFDERKDVKIIDSSKSSQFLLNSKFNFDVSTKIEEVNLDINLIPGFTVLFLQK